MDNDIEIYKGKNFSDLCKDIVKNSEEKKQQIDILMTDLREMIKTINDAVMVVPLLKEYFDVGIRNDEQLVKLAAIIQRAMSSRGDSGGESGNVLLTDEERKQIMATIEEVAKPAPKLEAPKEKSK